MGRIVRLSTNMRTALTDTINKCTHIMRNKPEELKQCVEIIQSCTDMLTIAGKRNVSLPIPALVPLTLLLLPIIANTKSYPWLLELEEADL